jgi:hypothetical protein
MQKHGSSDRGIAAPIRGAPMAAHRRLHHVHTSWPAPITGVIASLLFAIFLVVYAFVLLHRG